MTLAEVVIHDHQWGPDATRWTRLVGDVYQRPVACDCGATAWQRRWAGLGQVITGVKAPAVHPAREGRP